MRPVLTTFVGVLLALLVYAGVRAGYRHLSQQLEQAEEANQEERGKRTLTKAYEANLKTPEARLTPLEPQMNFLWPPVLENHDKWKLAALAKACGKPKKADIYNDGEANIGGVDYADASGNLVHFEFGPTGVTVSYADPKHVTKPDLIGSINSIPCLSAAR